jgi:hypothetical protein
VLLLLGAGIHAEADNLRIERGELAGAPTEVGGLSRSTRGVRLGEKEKDQILVATELTEIERAAVVLGQRGGWECVA